MNKIVFGFLIVIGLIATSCECESGARGIVYDNSTKESLSGVSIIFSFNDNNEQLETGSDSNGYYTVGGLGGRCRSTRVVFEKEGYESQVVSVPKEEYNYELHIYLVQSE
jgi:hypothetical protein